MEPYTVNNNIIKWSGFYNNDEEAQECLERRLIVISNKKRVISAKKELQVRDNSLVYKLKDIQKTTAIKKLLLYRFTVVTASLEEKLD